MLSYRHAFHAGNAADVLKHLVLCSCLHHLTQKETAILYAETHAGAGAYVLDEGWAAMNSEWMQGLERLRRHVAQHEGGKPPAIKRYLERVSAFEATEGKLHYSGSPVLARSFLRPQDRSVLFELHPADHEILHARFGDDAQVEAHREDGLATLGKRLPPPSRRALVLIDPSYEVKEEYNEVVERMTQYLRRFATGTYIIWYPLLERDQARELPHRLLALDAAKACRVELRLREPSPDGYGMSGSGMVIFNPPWTLRAELGAALPFLKNALELDPMADWTLEWRE